MSSENFSCRHDEKSSPVKPCQGQFAGTMGSDAGRGREPDVERGLWTVYLQFPCYTMRGGGSLVQA